MLGLVGAQFELTSPITTVAAGEAARAVRQSHERLSPFDF
jgi:hypothetical protein